MDFEAAVRYYKELAPESSEITFEALLDLSEEGDRKAVEALEKQAIFLGKGLRLLAYAFSPEVVLVDGSLVSARKRFAPIIEKELANPPLPGIPPLLKPTYEGGLARLRGAAAVVLQRHSGVREYRKVPGAAQALPA